MTLCIDNQSARHLWLDSLQLSEPPIGQRNSLEIIERLGFVQLDSIVNVVRAHHHIIWSRNQHYRTAELDRLLRGGAVFEHFTHDASILPISRYALWRRQFERLGSRIARSTAYRSRLDRRGERALLERIAREGPLSSQAFASSGRDSAMWARPAHKQTLDYLWYRGTLATAYRQHFRKYYDLAERVIPDCARNRDVDPRQWLDSLCTAALERLVFATAGDLQRFWGVATQTEVGKWLKQNDSRLAPVSVTCADGRQWTLFAFESIEQRLSAVRKPTTRLRILNPFDPVIRDRRRIYRLFGFDYRNEIFVPPEKRRYGYYVYPLLEGERFVGRLELRAERSSGVLKVCDLWPDASIRWTERRSAKLDAELDRLRRLAMLESTLWCCTRPSAKASNV